MSEKPMTLTEVKAIGWVQVDTRLWAKQYDELLWSYDEQHGRLYVAARHIPKWAEEAHKNNDLRQLHAAWLRELEARKTREVDQIVDFETGWLHTPFTGAHTSGYHYICISAARGVPMTFNVYAPPPDTSDYAFDDKSLYLIGREIERCQIPKLCEADYKERQAERPQTAADEDIEDDDDEDVVWRLSLPEELVTDWLEKSHSEAEIRGALQPRIGASIGVDAVLRLPQDYFDSVRLLLEQVVRTDVTFENQNSLKLLLQHIAPFHKKDQRLRKQYSNTKRHVDKTPQS